MLSHSFSLLCVFAGKRDIRALPVKCYIWSKCKWQGTVSTLEEHMAMCKFALVPCPNLCKTKLIRKNLDSHLNARCPNRHYSCQYCGEEGTYATITQIHDKTCRKKVISCPNKGCTETMKRFKTTFHVIYKCEYTEVSCKYANFGCKVKLKRKDMTTHEKDDKIHLHLALGVVVELKDTVVELKDAVDKLEDLLKKKDKKESEMFKITDYAKKRFNDEMFTSPSFYTSPEGYHMSVIVYANGVGDDRGTHVSVYVHILEGRNDSKLKWPFIGSVEIELLNQLKDDSHYIQTVPFEKQDNVQVGNGWGYPQFIPHSELSHNPSNNTQYLKDNTLYFRVSVKVPDHKPWLECP